MLCLLPRFLPIRPQHAERLLVRVNWDNSHVTLNSGGERSTRPWRYNVSRVSEFSVRYANRNCA